MNGFVPRIWRTVGVGLLGGALLLGAGQARAQSDEELALARQWFKDADTAEKKKDYETALGLYKKAAQVKETPQLLLRIGSCQDRLGDPVAALVSYERAQERAGLAGPDKAKVEEAAKEVIEGVRGRIATLTLAPKEPYKDLTVKLDGAPLAAAALGDKLPLNPGAHKVTAEAPGRRPFEESFSVGAKDAKTVSIELDLDPSAVAPPRTGTPGPGGPGPGDPATPDRGGAPSPLPIVLIAGGGAAVVAGVVLLVVAQVKDGNVDDKCGGSARICPLSRKDEIESDISSVKTFQILAGAIGGAGLVAAGIGTALLVAAPKRPASTGAGSTRMGTTLRVLPTGSSTGMGLAARGSF